MTSTTTTTTTKRTKRKHQHQPASPSSSSLFTNPTTTAAAAAAASASSLPPHKSFPAPPPPPPAPAVSSSSPSSPRIPQKLVVRPAKGDGNCLFRSVSIQVYGDESWHDRVRADCVDFMRKDEAHFSSFVSEPFPSYVDNMSHLGVFGDHVELQAMAELYSRPVIVYSAEEEGEEEEKGSTSEQQVFLIVPHLAGGTTRRARTLNIFYSATSTSSSTAPIRLCYGGRTHHHYDAVIDPQQEATVGVGLGLDSSFRPGQADRDLVEAATRQTDVDATQDELVRSVVEESLRDFGGGSSSSSTSAAVRELVLNGFPLDSVLIALSVAGDSFDDMLALLQHQL